MLYQGIIGGGSSPVEPVDLSPVLLWTNPSPTTEFAEQKVELDLTNYIGVIIEYGTITNTTVHSRLYVKKSDTLTLENNIYLGGGYTQIGSSENRAYARGISAIDNTGITFGVCVNALTTQNFNCVPIKIYGVKEYVVEAFKPIDATVCERVYTFPATSGKTNTWTVNEDGLYFLTGDAPGISDSRGSISLIGDITLISGSEPVRVFKAKAGAQVALIVSSGSTFTPYVNRIK